MSGGSAVDELIADLIEESSARVEAEQRLQAYWRVAAEAMKLLTKEQLAELRHKLDAAEGGGGSGAQRD